MYCGNCGTEIKEGARFCTECGSPIVQASSKVLAEAAAIVEGAQEQLQTEGIAEAMQEGQRRSKAKMSPLVLISLVLALMAGTAFAAYYVYTEIYLPHKESRGASQSETVAEPSESQETAGESMATEAEPSPDEILFANNFGMFTFATNVGTWGTDLEITDGGFFSGSYHDIDIVGGDGYLATMHKADYRGKFSVIEEITPTVYKIRMDELAYENIREEISDDYLIVPSEVAPGLPDVASCKAYDWYLYLPGQYVTELPENVLHHLSITGLDNLISETLEQGQSILYVNYGNLDGHGDQYAVFVAFNSTVGESRADRATQTRHEVAGDFEFDIPAYWEGRVRVDVVSDSEVYIRPNNAGATGNNYLVEITRKSNEGVAMAGGDVSASLHKSGLLDDGTYFGVRCITPQAWFPPGQPLNEEILMGLSSEQYAELLDLATGGLVVIENNRVSETLYPAPIMEEFAESVIVTDHDITERYY